MDLIANWLLQGTAVAFTTTLILRLWPGLSATTRYRVWWLALASVLALPVLPWLSAAPVAPVAAVTVASSYAIELPMMPRWPVGAVLLAYAGWLVWSLGRVGRDLLRLRALKRQCRDLPLERQTSLTQWTALRRRGRQARLVVSDQVRSASVLGLTAPAIALSPALLRGLEDHELDCVVVHEWAHVQRRDDGARLLQVVVRAVAGFHPAVWWLDRQLHIDRETACDDWTVNLTGSARRYAACLTKIAALDLTARDTALAPAALSASDLTRRVMRLLDRRRSTSTERPAAATAFALPLLAVLAFVVAGLPLFVPSAPEAVLTFGRSVAAALPPMLAPTAPDSEPAPEPQPLAPAPRRQRAPASAAPSRAEIVPAVDVVLPTPAPVPQPRDPVVLQNAVNDAPAVEQPQRAASPVRAPDVSVADPAPTPGPPDDDTLTPWDVARDAGVTVGKGSRDAAVATAGFFSRLGRSIARSF